MNNDFITRILHLSPYFQLGSDVFMTREVYVAQRLHARLSTSDNPVYNYLFAFDGEWNHSKKMLNVTLPGELTVAPP